MEHIKVPKVENVICWRQGKSVIGVLILSPHHITFQYPYHSSRDEPDKSPQPPTTRQTWITFPMIGHCAYKPSSRHPSIRLRCRDFNFMTFIFEDDAHAKSVFESIRTLTCRLGSVNKLYAFTYQPKSSERPFQGWSLYDPVKEFTRMGTFSDGTESKWRISSINSNFVYSDTYPAVFCVPAVISDTTLKHAGSFRSKARIPALAYFHPVNSCTITRSSQPLVGIRAARSPQDERLVGAIFETTKPTLKPLPSASSTPGHGRSTSDLTEIVDDSASPMEPIDLANVDMSEDSVAVTDQPEVKVYGAQQSNLIVDARPRVNAIANHLQGKGTERMEGYKTARMAYLDIDNIHVMRRSLAAVVDALKDTDIVLSTPDRSAIDRKALINSKWLHHVSRLLTGARQIASTIAIQHSHVLIHCSDGWDRTSQLSALSQICLDPFYRTIDGFIVLVEKDWLSFGHMFRNRSGLLSHENWFEVTAERGAAREGSETAADSPDTGNAFEKTIGHVQNLLRRKAEPEDSEGDNEASPSKVRKGKDKDQTDLNDISPIFQQFLDAVYQLLRQFPTRFEYNERFLRRLVYHLYSCQYGTFLHNSEKERLDSKAKERTRSVWDYFLSQKQQFVSEKYDPVIDDNDKNRTSLLLPNGDNVRWWYEVFNRSDEEMNGDSSFSTAPLSNQFGVESSTDGLESSVDTTAAVLASTSLESPIPRPSSTSHQESVPSGPVSSNNTSRLGDWASNIATDISSSSPMAFLSRSIPASSLAARLPSKSSSKAASDNTSQNASAPSNADGPASHDADDAFSGVTLADISKRSGTSSLTAQWMSGQSRGGTSPEQEVEMK